MDPATRAYAGFVVKAVDETRRTFSGWATTGATDRVGDTINPLGVVFKNPLVLLRGHSHDEPIGQVNFQKPTSKGVQFDAEIPVVDEPSPFKDRVDAAWAEVKYGAVRAVSIGFRALKYSFNDDGGIDYDAVEVYELSTVAVPALPQAVITSIKSMNGAPLPSDIVRAIREADSQGDGSIKLIRPRTLVSGIKLTK